MIVAVVGSAQRNREFVAHLATHGPWLRVPHMVGVAGAALANQTGMRGNEFEVSLVAEVFFLGDRKDFVLRSRWLWKLFLTIRTARRRFFLRNVTRGGGLLARRVAASIAAK